MEQEKRGGGYSTKIDDILPTASSGTKYTWIFFFFYLASILCWLIFVAASLTQNITKIKAKVNERFFFLR
jgi:hypothetical protein